MRGFTGFRTPGGTVREQLQAQIDTAEARAVKEAQKLSDMIGHDNYRLWFELTFPNKSYNLCSWGDLYETHHRALWLGKYALLSELECTCRPDGDLCRVCKAQNRLGNHD